jgi:ankyrin repeat protein
MDPRTEFLEAATWHGSLERAELLLAQHPALRSSDIHTAAVVGDAAAVQRFLAADPGNATRTSPPYEADALTYLGLSKYLRHHPERTPAFVDCATALLDAGADPNTGFWTTGAHPERETALYGAAGVAHNPELTRLLLERGADPNDVEAVYHSPETHDNRAMQLLVESGKVTPENLSLMLIRKHDWHDYDGAKYLLERGIDPNLQRERGWLPIHHAIARNNGTEMVALLLDHGADPLVRRDGATAIERAVRRGRSDLIALFKERGFPLDLQGLDRLLAACASDDAVTIRRIRDNEPALVAQLLEQGPRLLTEFTASWNTAGVRHLLELGVPVTALYAGDGYFDIAEQSMALHVAAWFLRADLVQLLLEHGSPVDPKDGKGRTPLQLAVKGCVDSYWSERRTPEPARLLVAAGAKREGIRVTGYAALDAVLQGGTAR